MATFDNPSGSDWWFVYSALHSSKTQPLLVKDVTYIKNRKSINLTSEYYTGQAAVNSKRNRSRILTTLNKTIVEPTTFFWSERHRVPSHLRLEIIILWISMIIFRTFRSFKGIFTR